MFYSVMQAVMAAGLSSFVIIVISLICL